MSATPSQAISDHTLNAEPSAAASTRIEPFQFTGTGGEYFRIWIVNLLLTVLTLGIYSAWAKVRRMRYFYGSTRLAGSAFEYHGKPLQILKGRLIAVGVVVVLSVLTTIWPLTNVLFVLLILFGTPWIIVKARTFHMRVSSYRNIRFNFQQEYGEAARIFIGLALLITPTLACLPVDNAGDGNTKGPTAINGEEVDPLIGWCLTYFVNFSGHPAASIPAGLSDDDLPVGMQIIGRRYADADVLAASAMFERLRPWQDSYRICAERAV